MKQKNLVRKKYYLLRKKKYYKINKFFFTPLVNLIKSKFKKKKIKLALFYPSSFEINVLNLLKFNFINSQNLLLPVIEDNNTMNFFSWKINQVMQVNRYGILEPIKSKQCKPDIMLVPLLAFDREKYRLGYGEGFYDRYLNKYLKRFNNILTVGIAFSFQKYHKLPINNKDVKLDFILTEEGIY
jgi:5-formyltetrahydrofolate cyclo-ligase